MATQYAVTQEMDPGTGDVRMNGSLRKRGVPATEVVLRILRTDIGSYVPDPTQGREYAKIAKKLPNITRVWQAETIRALRHLVENGVISNLKVEVQTTTGGRLLEMVSFVDPRSADNLRREIRQVVG